MKTVNTFIAVIYCSLENRDTSRIHKLSEVYGICQKYVDSKGECVNIITTKYVYTNGCEDGVRIEFINYPRFPKAKKEIKDRAIQLANILLVELEQCRVSVVFPNKTIMLSSYKVVT